MPQEMVKKSVDITQEDDEWLEEQPLNFSKWVRAKIAQKRLQHVSDHKKEQLKETLQKLADKGQELRDEWEQEKEEFKEEYDAEIVHREPETFAFKVEDKEYSSDWIADHVAGYEGKADEDSKGYKFADEYTNAWQDKVNRFAKYVDEETSFEPGWTDEYGQTFNGTGYMKKFTISSGYVPTGVKSFTVKYDSRVDVEIQDLESEF